MATIDVPGTRARAAKHTRLFAVLLLSAVVVAQLALPFRLAGIGFALWGLVAGVRALAALATLSRAGERAPGRLGLALGLGAAGTVLTMLALEAVIYPLAIQRQDCLAGAGTQAARRACDVDQRRRIDELQDHFGVNP